MGRRLRGVPDARGVSCPFSPFCVDVAGTLGYNPDYINASAFDDDSCGVRTLAFLISALALGTCSAGKREGLGLLGVVFRGGYHSTSVATARFLRVVSDGASPRACASRTRFARFCCPFARVHLWVDGWMHVSFGAAAT